LWALLVIITVRKCARKVREVTRQKAYGGKEISIVDVGGGSGVDLSLIAREPTPDEVVALADLVETMMRALGEKERPIVQLRLQNHEVQEIAKLTGFSSYTISLAIKRAKKQLEKNLADEIEIDVEKPKEREAKTEKRS
jgi:RNA polymerase sigma factor (sigma-70 family)